MISRKVLAVSFAFALLSPGCKRRIDTPLTDADSVLLITLDTTRADRLGCYGYEPGRTPALDGLAARGVLFEQAFAQAPLTLPSHATMMTGRYPREHGLRVNGRGRLGGHHPTLASLFKERGYHTGAFVGSYALDSRFGLDRGFDVYVDDMSGEGASSPFELRAGVVTDRALEWLAAGKRQPFFCWVHYFDPHDPYSPPKAFRVDDMDPYDGEIAYVDSQVRRLLDWLERSGWMRRTVVIVVGDHGESFGEHRESGHTDFLYDTNLHVPLIFAHPTLAVGGGRVGGVVEVADLFPTIVQLVGLKLPKDVLSRSVADALGGGKLEPRVAYSESLYLFSAFGWAQQRSVTSSEWKYISSTKAELYDRRSDPHEKENLIDTRAEVAVELLNTLRERYNSMIPSHAASLDSRDGEKALRSLGYVRGRGVDSEDEVFLNSQLLDPKEVYDVAVRFREVEKLVERAGSTEQYARAIPVLRELVIESPNGLFLHNTLGMCLLRSGDAGSAIPVLERAVEIDPQHKPTRLLLADALLSGGRIDSALAEFESIVWLDEQDVDVRLRFAEALQRVGRTDGAAEQCRRAIELAPDRAGPHARLCGMLQDTKQLATAVRNFHQFVNKHAGDPLSHLNLGSAYLRLKRRTEAVAQFREAIRLKADFGDAMINLGMTLVGMGDAKEARTICRQALTVPGFDAQARYCIGRAFQADGRIKSAVSEYEKAIAVRPSYATPVDELARHYVGQRRVADAVRVLRRGVEADPRNVRLANSLGQILATCRDDSIRDGSQAVAHLERAAQLVGFRDVLILQNLAAAYAEVGEFDRAVETAQRALALAESARNTAVAGKVRSQLDGYRRGRPYRDANL